MAKGKPPAFLFYPDAWLSSTDILLMSAAEERGYLRLLCHQWLSPDCSLADDDGVLAKLTLLEGEWTASKSKLLAKFSVKDGRIFNERLRDERKKRDEWVKKSSKAGKKSAKGRAEKQRQPPLQPTVNQTSTNLQPPLQPNDDTRIENIIAFKTEEIDTIQATEQVFNLAGALLDESYEVSELELTNALWEIHPSPSEAGDVEKAISKEFFNSSHIPRARLARQIISSLQSWAAYWEAEGRFPTGLRKWVDTGDWARKAPVSKKLKPKLVASTRTYRDVIREEDALEAQDQKDREARHLAQKAAEAKL